MQLYFDESGTFAIPHTSETHAVGIVVGMDIPEADEAKVFSRYQYFLNSLAPSALKNGEPKGNLLSAESLRRVAEMLDGCTGVLLATTLLELISLAGGGAERAKESMVKELQVTATQCVHQTMRDQMQLLSRQ